jgi:uncharacterized protein YhaN
MRIERLSLLAFGPFTDHTIDLNEPGLQVIYGENGAGKTTAMRALQGLLFSIPHQSTDGWVHGKGVLVGGSVAAGDGEALEFLRRKGTKNTLLGLDQQPIDQDALGPILAGLTKDLFTSMYGLNHQRLRDGGEELLRGRGQLGEALFGAGIGAGALAVLHDLEREADGLFRPRGQNQKVNAGVSAFHNAVRDQRAMGTTVTEWEKLTTTVEQARAEVVRLDTSAAELRIQQSAADRLRTVLGPLAERTQALEQIDELSAVPELDENASQLRLDAVARLNAAQLAADRSTKVIDRRRKEIEELDPPQIMIDRLGEITALFQRVGEIRKDRIDLPSLQRQHREHLADAQRSLRDIDPDLTVEAAEAQRVSTAVRRNIEELATRRPDLDAQLAGALRQRDDTFAEVQEREKDLNKEPDPIDVANLTRVAGAIAEDGDLEQRLQGDTGHLEALRSSAELLVTGLEQTGNDPTTVAALPVVMKTTVEQFREAFADLDRRAETLAGHSVKAGTELRQVQERLDELDRTEQIPTQEDLDEARARRDAGWQAVRASWLEGNDEPGREFDATKPLPEAFEENQHLSDDVADRLRGDADRVAAKAQLTAAQERLRRDADEHDQAVVALGNEKERCEKSWLDEWTAAAIKPRTPTEMLQWITRHEELRQAVADIDTAVTSVSRTTTLIADHRKTLSRVLIEIGEPAIGDDETLRIALARADSARTNAIEATQRRGGLEKTIIELRAKAQRHESTADEARRVLDAWETDWKKAVEHLGLPEGSTLAAATAVLDAFDAAFSHLRDAEKLMSRIEGLERDIERFEADTAALVTALDPTLDDKDPITAVERLNERALKAKNDRTKVESNQRQIAEEIDNESLANVEKAAAQRELDDMSKRAGVDDITAIEAVEQAAAERRKLRERLIAIEETITTTGADSVDALTAQAAETDPDKLSAGIAALEDELTDVAQQRDEANRRHGEAQSDLRRIEGSGDAAHAAERAQRKLAEVRVDAERYVRVKLAVILLKQAMDDYREQTQGPVLARARVLFPQLTAGVFDSLVSDFNDADEAVIRAVRGEQRIGVQVLSDGERDALYLALRIATLEYLFTKSAPIPVVLDDVLLNFDDERAIAGFEALHELSKHTQVIFFTHHDHLVKLAQKAIVKDGLAIHHLPVPIK